jgi:circadian clock protein KaiB
MDENNPVETAVVFERLLIEAKNEQYDLRLFVTGMTRRSLEAIASVRALCENHLKGRYRLEVVDIYQQPTRARDDQVIAAPTLVRALPRPIRRLIGDLANEYRLLNGLEIQVRGPDVQVRDRT